MKTDSAINIRGTFLDKDIKQESLVQSLIKGFEDADKELGRYKNSIDSVINSITDLELNRLMDLAISYYFKCLSSTWLTRWYWKRRHKKTCKQFKDLLNLRH